MNFQSLKFEDIVAWCKENNQVEWLKKEAAKTFPAMAKSESGEKIQLCEADGTPKTRRITFIELKMDFVRAFMPEIAPQPKEKKPSMFDIINSL